MKTYLDCMPCFVRQTLDSIRMTTDDEEIQQRVMRKTVSALADMPMNQPPPVMARQLHRLIRQESGNPDPYESIKGEFNEFAQSLLPELEEKIATSDNPLELALRLCIAGNIIDLGVKGNTESKDVHEAIEYAFMQPLDADLGRFCVEVEEAERILYVADNAGEIVFDRLFLQQLPLEKITLAVRGWPIINDVTRTDAEAVGITELVPVIDNGDDAPGTVLKDCSTEFQRAFLDADLIIAKGQGNFETLNDVDANIWFALKVKCQVLIQHLDASLGTMIFKRSDYCANDKTGTPFTETACSLTGD